MDKATIKAIQSAAYTKTAWARKQGYSLEAVHTYTAPDGAFLYARLRLKNPVTSEKKIFPLHRNTSGKWELKEPKFEGAKPLYNLRQLCDQARLSERVILVEGELKVDMLSLVGILATTSGGAQSVEAADCKPLAGRKVLAWADNDNTGFEYVQHAADKLRALGSEVTFVDVAALNLPPKGDVVDWLKAFHQQHGREATAADIWALPVIERAPGKGEVAGGDLSTSIASGDATPLSGSIAQAGAPPAQSDEEKVQWLASLTQLEYGRVRKDQAKALGVPVGTLDGIVKTVRSDGSEAGRLPFDEVEPHPHPIIPAQLLDEVVGMVQRFIVLEPEQAYAVALWIALTWFIDEIEIAPLAIINAPEKSCGKTQLLTVMERMTYRPLPASNASPSALFRAVELWKPTILIDEADTFFRDNFELHGMVNAGYLRIGFVLRSEAVGDSFVPRMYSVFSAKAIAGVALEKHLSDALMSRGIIINLRRKLSHELVSRLRHAGRGIFTGIAEKLARFADDYAEQVRDARPSLPDALSDRDQDNWEPLLAIASCAGAEWLARATAAALKLSGGDKTPSIGNELLADIQHVFESLGVDKIRTAELIEALCKDEEGPWETYNRGKQINPRQVARYLKAYGISSKNIRLDARKISKGFELSQFSEAFQRYLATPPELSATPLHSAGKSMKDELPAVADSPLQRAANRSAATAANPSTRDSKPKCSGVADKTPGMGKNKSISDTPTGKKPRF